MEVLKIERLFSNLYIKIQGILLINLEKNLKKGELRFIGKNCEGLAPSELPIAVKDFNKLKNIGSFDIYRFKNYSEKNVLLLFNGKKSIYLYVNPYYTSYRKVFEDLLGKLHNKFDVDHVFAKGMAKKLKFSYILLALIPRSVNRSHGAFEKKYLYLGKKELNELYSNDRIYNKILFRGSTSNRVLDYSQNKDILSKQKKLLSLNNLNSKTSKGLALNQLGIWHSSFGLDILNEIKDIEVSNHEFKRVTNIRY